MAIARIGSVAQLNMPIGDSGSGSMTVQSGADFFLICGVGWRNIAGMFTNGTYTLGGQPVTLAISTDASNIAYYCAMFYRLAPTAGAQTFTWNFGTGNGPINTDNGSWVYASYSGVDQTNPIRSAQMARSLTQPITTPTLTAAATDLLIAWAAGYSPGERTFTITGATKVYDATRNGDGDGALAEASPTGNQTVTSNSGVSSDDGGLSAIVLRATPGTPSNTTRDIRVSGVTVTPSNRTQDIRIVGTASDQLTIPVTILLGTPSNTTRDIRITSSVVGTSSNTTRDLRITGLSTSSTTRDIRIFGEPSSSSMARDIMITGDTGDQFTFPVTILLGGGSNVTRDIRITGLTTVLTRAIVTWAAFQTSLGVDSNTTRDLRIRGQATSNIAQDIRIRGQALSNTTRDVRITGFQPSGFVTVDRSINIAGGVPWIGATVTYKAQEQDTTLVADLRITGQLSTSNTTDLRVTGQVVNANVSRDIAIRGQNTSNTTRDLRTTGQLSTSAARDTRITGYATDLVTRNLNIIGQQTSNRTQDLRIRGQAVSNTSQDVRITGRLDNNISCDVRIRGQQDTVKTVDLRITGQLDSNVMRDIWVAAEAPIAVSVPITIIGQLSNEVSRDLNTFGEVGVQTNINAWIVGSSANEVTVPIRVSGMGADSITNDIRITGSLFSLEMVTRDIRIYGRAVNVARPDGDISSGSWVAVPSGTLASTIDEVIPDESDYMKSPSDFSSAIPNATNFNTAQNAMTGCIEHFPLTESSLPFASVLTASSIGTAINSPTTDTADPCFAGESYLKVTSNAGVRGYVANTFDYQNVEISGWFRPDAIPSSIVNLAAYGDNFNNGGWEGIALKPDMTITWLKGGIEYGNPSQVLEVGKWYHLAVLWRPATITPMREFAINGTVVLSESTLGYGGVVFSQGLKLAGDGFVGGIAHVALYNGTTSISNMASLYQYRSTNHTAEVSLSNVADPQVNRYHVVRYRIASKESPSKKRLKVVLLQGSTEIASWVHDNIGSVKTFEHELTEAQTAAITDYTDLRLRFIGSNWFEETSRDIRVVGS